MGVFQYNKQESTAQKCTIAVHNDTVCQVVRYFNGLPQDHDPAGTKVTILEFLVPTFNTEQYFHFLLIYCVLLLLVHGDRHPNIMKTFNVLSFHKKSVMYQKNTINTENNRKNMCITNTQWLESYHRVTAEELGLLYCCSVWMGNWFQTLRKI